MRYLRIFISRTIETVLYGVAIGTIIFLSCAMHAYTTHTHASNEFRAVFFY